MNRPEGVRPDLVVVGSETETRKKALEQIKLRVFEFLQHRDPNNKEETVLLLYNIFCEMDEQFTGGVCTLEGGNEDDEEKVKRIIAEFVNSLPAEYGGRDSYRKSLQLELCYGAMVVELSEQNIGNGTNMLMTTLDATPEITDVFVGDKIYKPEIK
jgi:hypothetical protein